jgi:hypothetical protein
MLNVRTAKQFKKSPLAIYRAAIKLAAAYLSFSLSTARDEEGVNQAAKTRARETVDYLEKRKEQLNNAFGAYREGQEVLAARRSASQ